MELKDIKQKIAVLSSALGDLSSSLSQVEKSVSDELKKKSDTEQEHSYAKSNMEKKLTEHSIYLKEFNEKIKQERDSANKLIKEAQTLMVQAEDKNKKAEEYMASAKKKDEVLSDKNVAVESLRVELERKVNRAKEFVQNF